MFVSHFVQANIAAGNIPAILGKTCWGGFFIVLLTGIADMLILDISNDTDRRVQHAWSHFYH
jgi:hypothetical protein